MEGQPQSVFSGQKYNPSQNTRTHYKAGRSLKKDNTRRKPRQKKNNIQAVGVGSYDPSDRYGTMSVFKK